MKRSMGSKFAGTCLLLLVFLSSHAFAAPFLACDLPTGTPSAIQVEITPPGGAAKIVNGAGSIAANGKDYIVYDLDKLGLPSLAGYQFRIKWTIGGGTSDWSSYYKVGKTW